MKRAHCALSLARNTNLEGEARRKTERIYNQLYISGGEEAWGMKRGDNFIEAGQEEKDKIGLKKVKNVETLSGASLLDLEVIHKTVTGSLN